MRLRNFYRWRMRLTDDPTHRDYDMHGPAGPTAFWKVSDSCEDDRNSGIPFAYY